MKDNHGVVEVSKCPACGYANLDCATGAFEEDLTPKPGDLSLCIRCGDMLVFTDKLGLRLPTKEEYENLPDYVKKQIIQAQIVIRGSPSRPAHLGWPPKETAP